MKRWIFSLLVSSLSLYSYEVLVLAEPIIDRNCVVDNATFRELALEKGETQLIDKNTLEQHTTRFFHKDQRALAGSGMNVIKGLAKLEHNCAAIGIVGNDDLGNWIEEELETLNIDFLHNKVEIPTTQCLCFITPDKERTMLTYVGASARMQEHLLNPKDFENLKFFHLEGYQIFQEPVARAALELAKQNHATISINLATPHLAKLKKAAYLDLIQRYANIVFCNEAEAVAISDQSNAMEACKWLAQYCDIAVVTQGGKGGILHSNGVTIPFQAKKVHVKDTTGAGDLFSSGFIHAYLKGRSLEECLLAGRDIAAQVVSVYGVDIPEQAWIQLKESNR